MSGVYVVRHLLANYGPLIAIVPAGRIVAGELPLNTDLPAIGVSQVSSVPLNLIRINDTPKLHTDRVQVTVLCKGPQTAVTGTGYKGVKTILALVLAACPSQRGTVNSIAVDSIVPEIEGPDFYDDVNSIHSSSRDLLVRWSA